MLAWILKKVNDAFMNGAKAIQGRRVARDTSFAILDSCSEAVNNNIFRKAPMRWVYLLH